MSGSVWKKLNSYKMRSGISLVLCLILSCNRTDKKHDDFPPPPYPPPVSVLLNTDSGYIINTTTGDSIQAIENRTVKTGVPIPAIPTRSDSNLSTPKNIPASWKFVDTLSTNTYRMPEKLKTVLVDESRLPRFVIGKDTNSFVLRGLKRDTISTGVPVSMTGKVVPSKIPKSIESLPMSVSPSANYNLKYLDTYHGLKYQNVYCVMEDRKGNLWICSIEGLSCFNGKTLLHFTEQQGLANNRAFYVLEDRNGDIWIDHGFGDISFYDGDKFIQYEFDHIKSRSLVGDNTMFEDSKGNIWFTNTTQGVTRFDGKSFIHYTKKEGLHSTEITCISEDSKGNIWFGSHDKGASRFNYDSFTYFNKENGLSNDVVHSIFEDRDRVIWFGTEGGVTKYDGHSFVSITDKDGLSSNSVGTIYQDSSGAIWVSTYGYGLNKLEGKNITHITEKEGLLSNFIWDMIPGKIGGRWLATTKGVVFFDDKSFVHRSLANLIPTHLLAVTTDHDDALLLGTMASGVYKFDGRKIWRLEDRDSGSYTIIKTLMKDRKGNLWIGTFGRGLLRFDGKYLQYLTEKEGLTSQLVNSLLEDSHGNIWIGSSKGLIKYDGKNFFRFTEKEGLSDEFIMSLIEDASHNIWIGSRNGGLTRFDGKSFIHYTEKEGLGSNYVFSIAIDRQGFIWLSSQYSVTVFNGKEFVNISDKAGFPKKFVNGVYCDSNGNIWVSNMSNLMQIPSNFLTHQTGEVQRGGIVEFKEVQSLGLQYIPNYLDKQNRLWMPENHKASLTMFDLNNYKELQESPKVRLFSIDINNRPFDYRNLDASELKEIEFAEVERFSNVPMNLKIPHYYNQITFHFYAANQASNNRIQFSHKIDELASDWSAPASEGKAYYQYLPPGTYTFRVRAMNRSMVWGDPLTYRFTIMSPFWQRWWFWLIVVGIGLSIMVWIVQRRINSIRKKEEEKTESIKRMAELELQSLRAQLNPHFMFNSLNAIQELILMEENEKSQSYLARFSKLLRMMLENADKPFIPLQREIDFLRLYLTLENLRIPDLQFSIDIHPGIDTEKTQIPNMILQPYIENAIWHGLSHKANDRRLEIRVSNENGFTKYEIEDNGVGRKRSAELKSLYRKEHKSKGMELLSKRFKLLAKEYGSEVETTITDVAQGPTTGTIVTIKVPANFKTI